MAISNTLADRDQYDSFASQYTQAERLPIVQLERAMIKSALGDCTQQRILDIGGGSGTYARMALDACASSVDVVDISREMMNIGAAIEEKEGRSGEINYLLGDVTKPLDHLGLRKESYDVVMANWVFDHATSVADMEGMWANIAAYANPGGRFLGIRAGDIQSKALEGGAYGVDYEDWREIEGGYAYTVVFLIEPVLKFEATTMRISCSGSTELHKKYGFKDVKCDYGEGYDLVKNDPEYWKAAMKDPWQCVVTAIKA